MVQSILLVQSMTQHRHRAHLYSTRQTQLDSRSKEEEEENEEKNTAESKRPRDDCFLPVGARRRPITLGRVRERPMRLRARAWVRFDWQNDWGGLRSVAWASAITLD